MSSAIQHRAFAGLMVALVLGACQSAPEPTTGQPAPPALSDANIAAAVVTVNEGAISAAELATTQATDPRVREYAQHLVHEHREMGQELEALLRREGISPQRESLTRQIAENNQRTLQALRTRTGADFDRTFVQHEVELHQWLITTLDNSLIPATRDRDLKAALQELRQGMQGHLEQARQLRASL